jgi:hypothetical protein
LIVIAKEQKEEAVGLFAEDDATVKAGTHLVELAAELAYTRAGVRMSKRVGKLPESGGDDVELGLGEGSEGPLEGLGRLDLQAVDFLRVGRFF